MTVATEVSWPEFITLVQEWNRAREAAIADGYQAISPKSHPVEWQRSKYWQGLQHAVVEYAVRLHDEQAPPDDPKQRRVWQAVKDWQQEFSLVRTDENGYVFEESLEQLYVAQRCHEDILRALANMIGKVW